MKGNVVGLALPVDEAKRVMLQKMVPWLPMPDHREEEGATVQPCEGCGEGLDVGPKLSVLGAKVVCIFCAVKGGIMPAQIRLADEAEVLDV